jgi:hypothetical protein
MSDELKECNILKLILIMRFACATLAVGHPIGPIDRFQRIRDARRAENAVVVDVVDVEVVAVSEGANDAPRRRDVADAYQVARRPVRPTRLLMRPRDVVVRKIVPDEAWHHRGKLQ